MIADNDFDVAGGTSAENVLGVTVFSAGDTATPVDARISGDRIRNNTEPAINLRRIVGHVSIDHNFIDTGPIGVPEARGSGIRVANLGTYVIAHNVIDCRWVGVADAKGIGVFSQISACPIEHAAVKYNRITMSQPAATAFEPFSAGIGLYGFANNSVVRHNIVRGAAQAGITMPPFPALTASASDTARQSPRAEDSCALCAEHCRHPCRSARAPHTDRRARDDHQSGRWDSDHSVTISRRFISCIAS